MNANSYPNYDAWFEADDGTLPITVAELWKAAFTGLAELALPFHYCEKITNSNGTPFFFGIRIGVLASKCHYRAGYD